jgi:hypothetical protein
MSAPCCGNVAISAFELYIRHVRVGYAGLSDRRPAEQEEAAQKASSNRSSCALAFTRIVPSYCRKGIGLFRLPLRDVHFV